MNDLQAAFAALPKPDVFRLTTDPVRRVLERLGRPQDRLPPVIHIAGTNGKGSTTAFIRALAEAHGLKVHVDTSPHLIRVNERIRIAGKLISDAELKRLTDRVLEANRGEPLSFFEGMTAASFLAFTETHADLTLVEVGLGGRFDSTNVMDTPRVSVITPIDFDHKDFLGHHLAQIAWEKAGIIKAGCPVVSADQTRDVHKTLVAEARYRKSDMRFLSEMITITQDETGLIRYQLNDLDVSDIRLSLAGPHQIQNAALALLALHRSELCTLDADKIRQGLSRAEWPARMQTLVDGPVTRALPGKTVIVDGGHNPHAAAAIYEALKNDAPIPVIMGMLNTKDAKAFLRLLAPLTERLITVSIPSSHNSHPPEKLARLARSLGIEAEPAASLEAALPLAAASDRPKVLIGGSLYLAGDVLKANGESIE